MNRKRPNWDKWLSRGNHLSQSESLEINFALAFEFDKLGAMQAAIVSIVYGSSVMHKKYSLRLAHTKPHAHSPAAANAHAQPSSENAASKYSG